ncbi:hypothetical protein [Flavobacterium sp.]|jgi:hypothetical protein|uniref:hypothetical protein n=1 Tax=Flavobacterium sp. TaxID=239 RepID=UPI002A7F2B7F|nr:hypothetical protein [Flavobacterium sp.]
MQLDGLLFTLPKQAKIFCAAFIIVLSVGYYTGLTFVSQTTQNSANGIEENYLGNEEDLEADTMKFKKGEREMITIIHTHILSLSFIFFLQGIFVLMTSLPKKLKGFLLVEPFVSILVTFGGIYVLWLGFTWAKYFVIISGIIMTLCFTISSIVILKQLLTFKSNE